MSKKRKENKMNTFDECAEKIRSYLNKNGVKHEERLAKDCIRFRSGFVGLRGAFSQLRLMILVDSQFIQTFVYIPLMAMQKRSEIAEFITRINYNMKCGRFEMDYNDGEVRFHLGQNVAVFCAANVDNVIEEQIFFPLMMVDKFSNAFKRLFAGEKAKDLYEEFIVGRGEKKKEDHTVVDNEE